MLKFLIGMVLFLTSAPLFAAEATDCRNVYAALVHPRKPLPLNSDPDSKYTYLGSGVAGGDVFEVRTSSGKIWVQKDYYAPFLMENDLKALAFLHALPIDPEKLSVVRLLAEKPPRTAIFERVEGRLLDDMLEDPGIPSEQKKILQTKFRDILSHLSLLIRKTPGFELVQEQEVSGLAAINRQLKVEISVKSPGESYPLIVRLLIKSDNIIVDPKTLEFTLIDPH